MDNFKQQQIETCKRYIINESLFGQQYDQLLEMMQEMNVELKIDFNNCYLILAGIEKRFYNSKLNLNREIIWIFLPLLNTCWYPLNRLMNLKRK